MTGTAGASSEARREDVERRRKTQECVRVPSEGTAWAEAGCAGGKLTSPRTTDGPQAY